MHLGIGTAALVAAAGAANALSKKNKSGGSARPSQPTRAAGPVTVSPAIQTQISPQISPVFQQTQSSPGASQSAAPSMISRGGQSADTGAPSPFSPGIKRRYPQSPRPGPTYTAPSPYYPPRHQQASMVPTLVKWGVIGGIGIIAFNAYQKNKFSRSKSKSRVKS